MGSWNMQEHWDSDLFCFGDGQICGGFPPLLRFVSKRTDLPLFLLHLRTAFFEAHLLSPLKIWQLRALKSYKVFMEPPYTIVTPYMNSVGLFSHVLSGSLFACTQWVSFRKKTVPHEVGRLFSYRLLGSLFICTQRVSFRLNSVGLFKKSQGAWDRASPFLSSRWVSFHLYPLGRFSCLLVGCLSRLLQIISLFCKISSVL